MNDIIHNYGFFDGIVNFIIQKLKSKYTSLQKYTNWAKLINPAYTYKFQLKTTENICKQIPYLLSIPLTKLPYGPYVFSYVQQCHALILCHKYHICKFYHHVQILYDVSNSIHHKTCDYGNTGCQVFKQGVQNWKYFCLKINIPKGNDWILRFGLMASWQKVPKFDFQSVKNHPNLSQFFLLKNTNLGAQFFVFDIFYNINF